MNDGAGHSFEERFASLEQASRDLSANVMGLVDGLRVIAQIQTEQVEQRRRQDEAEAALVAAKADADEREARTRKTFGAVSLALAVLLPLVSILVYWSLIAHVAELLDEQQAQFYKSCTIRNGSTREQIVRETALADAETDAVVEKIHRDSAIALTKGMPDCRQYLK